MGFLFNVKGSGDAIGLEWRHDPPWVIPVFTRNTNEIIEPNFEPFFDIKNKSKRTEYGGGKSPVNEIKKAELSPITDQRMMYILAIMLHESIDNNTEIIIQKDKDKVTKKLSSLYFYENGFINYINSEQNEKNRKLLRELRLAIDPFRNN